MFLSVAGFMFGDPHFYTLDGLQYTFNGLGEYWLVNSTFLQVQARTDLAWKDSNGTVSNATVFSAVSAQG
jgi:hypothetical protein